jgi:hypothetical protein
MARIGRIEVELGLQSGSGEAGVLRALRRLDPRQGFGAGLTRGEWAAGGRLQAFLVAAPALPGVRAPVFGAVGSVGVTKDERRLLRALAALRVGDDGLVDNYVFRLAIERGARAWLVDALRAFARSSF